MALGTNEREQSGQGWLHVVKLSGPCPGRGVSGGSVLSGVFVDIFARRSRRCFWILAENLDFFRFGGKARFHLKEGMFYDEKQVHVYN